jgi:hypothetical protein
MEMGGDVAAARYCTIVEDGRGRRKEWRWGQGLADRMCLLPELLGVGR